MCLWSGPARRRRRSARRPSAASLLACFLAKVAVDQFLGELDAFEFKQARILLAVLVKDHVDLPRAAEGLRVLNGCFVIHRVRIEQGVALRNVQSVAGEVSGAVEPRHAVEAGDIDHQRVAFPMSVRRAHPGVGHGGLRLAHVDEAIFRAEFVGDQDVLVRLDDLERKRHIVCARHARHVALHDGILLVAVREVFLFLLEGFGQIGDFIALHNALSGRNRADRPKLVEGSRVGAVGLDVPVGGAEGLPESGEVWLVGGGFRRVVLGRGRNDANCQRRDQRARKTVVHRLWVLLNSSVRSEYISFAARALAAKQPRNSARPPPRLTLQMLVRSGGPRCIYNVLSRQNTFPAAAAIEFPLHLRLYLAEKRYLSMHRIPKTRYLLPAGLALLAGGVMSQTRTTTVNDLALKNAGKTGTEWISYGLTPGETRYSPLKQIDASNVAKLGLAWSYDIGTGGGNQEATPLVWNGTIYSITNWSVVYAVDARTGKEK